MSKNINQITTAATSILATDKLYLGRSPFGITDDRYILGSAIISQFSPLTTKGDIYTFSSVNTRLPVATGDGKILQVSSGATTGLAYSTPTYPSTSGTAGKILASDGTNVVYTTATFPVVGGTAGNVLISNGTNYVASTSLWPNTVGTAGQIVISNGTSNTYSTPTYPNASVTAGKVIISDGTNYIASTSIFPNTVGASGKILISNGTINVYSTPTYPNTSGSAGLIFRSDGTNNVYSQTTYPDLVAASAILYANGANTIAGLTTANSSVLVTTSAGVPVQAGTMTNGQLIIGSTTATPVVASLTAGTGITVTPGAGSITIASTISSPFASGAGTGSARGGDLATVLAAGNYAFAMGNVATSASAVNSFAFGNACTATAQGCVSFGLSCVAGTTGVFAFAMGNGTEAHGDYNFSFGLSCFTTGSYSVAIGRGLNVNNAGSWAIGDGSASGTGSSTTNQFNATFGNGFRLYSRVSGTSTPILALSINQAGATTFLGDATAGSASAGYVGEVISSTIASASPTAFSNGITGNLTSISLTAGDWDVHGHLYVSGTTVTALFSAINTTSATLPDSSLYAAVVPLATSSACGLPTPYRRINVSSTTTVYLVGFVNGTGTLNGSGFISARRAR